MQKRSGDKLGSPRSNAAWVRGIGYDTGAVQRLELRNYMGVSEN